MLLFLTNILDEEENFSTIFRQPKI